VRTRGRSSDRTVRKDTNVSCFTCARIGRLLVLMLPKGFLSWWIQVERNSKTIKYGHQGCRGLLLPSALINKIRICCTTKVRPIEVTVFCPVSLVFYVFVLCEKGRLGMLTGRKGTVAYWTTSQGHVLFRSRKLGGKDEARIRKLCQNSFDWLCFCIPRVWFIDGTAKPPTNQCVDAWTDNPCNNERTQLSMDHGCMPDFCLHLCACSNVRIEQR